MQLNPSAVRSARVLEMGLEAGGGAGQGWAAALEDLGQRQQWGRWGRAEEGEGCCGGGQ